MEFDDDEPPPMMSSPKLTRYDECDETSLPTIAVAGLVRTSPSMGDGMGMEEPALLPTLGHLKPRDFRRKDPALHFLASIRGDTEELEAWLVAGGDSNARDGEGWTLLHHASVSLETSFSEFSACFFFFRFFGCFFLYVVYRRASFFCVW